MNLSDFVLNHARKAAATFVVTIAGALGTALSDGDLTRPEVLVAVGTALTATAAAYGFTNKPQV
jgi:hypothetical protein